MVQKGQKGTVPKWSPQMVSGLSLIGKRVGFLKGLAQVADTAETRRAFAFAERVRFMRYTRTSYIKRARSYILCYRL